MSEKKKFNIMKIFAAASGVCFAMLLLIHRRVIKAALTGEPMPESPHCHHAIRRADDV